MSNADNGSSASVEFPTRQPRRSVLVQLNGELDLRSVAQAEPLLLESLHGTDGDLVVDLSGLTFCDCAGLNMLIRIQKAAADRRISVRLAAPQGVVRRILEITGFGQSVATYDTVDTAVNNGEGGRIARIDDWASWRDRCLSSDRPAPPNSADFQIGHVRTAGGTGLPAGVDR